MGNHDWNNEFIRNHSYGISLKDIEGRQQRISRSLQRTIVSIVSLIIATGLFCVGFYFGALSCAPPF